MDINIGLSLSLSEIKLLKNEIFNVYCDPSVVRMHRLETISVSEDEDEERRVYTGDLAPSSYLAKTYPVIWQLLKTIETRI